MNTNQPDTTQEPIQDYGNLSVELHICEELDEGQLPHIRILHGEPQYAERSENQPDQDQPSQD